MNTLFAQKKLLEERLGVPVQWKTIAQAAGINERRIYSLLRVNYNLGKVNAATVVALAQGFTKLGLPTTVAELVDGEDRD